MENIKGIKMVWACPICDLDGVKIVGIPTDGDSYGWSGRVIEEYYTLGELIKGFDIGNPDKIDVESIVINTFVVKNVYCSGKVVLGISLARHKSGYYFRRYTTTIYVVVGSSGKMKLVRPYLN